MTSKYKKPTNHTFRLAELFCGPGGIAVAAKNSKYESLEYNLNIESVWANDIDSDACRTYAKNIKHREYDEVKDIVVCADINEISDFGEIPFYDSLAFGFPCNDFSNVGESKGLNGYFGPLYKHGVRFLQERSPVWFLAENVGGLSSANEGAAFESILHDLENVGSEKHNGYRIVAHLYKFEEYGVPQARHRIIIVGFRGDLDLHFAVPAPTTLLKDSQISCQMAIDNPPINPESYNNEHTSQSSIVVERLMCIPPGENAWYLDRVAKYSDRELKKEAKRWQKFSGRASVTASEIRDVLSRVRLNVKSARMSHIYKRLDPLKPSYTITGSGGGGTHVYHWDYPRALTNRERARLQTFPDDYEFIGSKESVRKQIGMAVPPDGAKAIFEAILKTFAGCSYSAVTPNLYVTGCHKLVVDNLEFKDSAI